MDVAIGLTIGAFSALLGMIATFAAIGRDLYEKREIVVKVYDVETLLAAVDWEDPPSCFEQATLAGARERLTTQVAKFRNL